MDYSSLPEDIKGYQSFLERVNSLLESRRERLGLEPKVLAHFNDWASKSIVPMFSELGLSLQPATVASYCHGGFEIELGEIHRDGRLIFGDFFDDDIHDAIEKYEDETPWVRYVETHFDIPK